MTQVGVVRPSSAWLNNPMAEVKQIGNHTYQRLTNEETLAKYGSSFVFVGTPSAPPLRKAMIKLKNNAKKSNRSPQ
jgi:hypothetical protein